VPASEDANAVVRLVIQLARALRLNVIAEGVENPQQASFLSDAGCRTFQGYLYSPALSAQDATGWLRRLATQP
jgi:EAL domain-containing protein (putative c-di-GMP-specific phosphodiesterase class I)